MSAATTREALKLYALRALGAPVLEINVDDDQLQDRIDEALQKYQEYHHEGVEKMYLKHQIKATTITIVDGNAGDYEESKIIVGSDSGATARIIVQSDGVRSADNTLVVRDALGAGTFIDGEEITCANLGLTSHLAVSDAVTLGEIDTHYIEVPDLVYGITRLLHLGGSTTSGNIFDFQYQLRLHDMYNLTSSSMIYYSQVMSHLTLLDHLLNAKPMMNFNRMQNRLYPLIDWDRDVVVGNYLVAEAYRGLDPAEFSKVWNHPWLKSYTTALFRRQWGQNLSKFGGLVLPGGVTLNGDAMMDKATQEITELEDRLRSEAGPLEFFMG